jgi:hypothetical protein
MARRGVVTGCARLAALLEFEREAFMFDATPAEVWAGALEINRTLCQPPLALDAGATERVTAAMRSNPPEAAVRKQLARGFAPTVRSQFTVEAANDFTLSDLPDFLVDGCILQGSVHAFYGMTQAGKTFAAMDLAMRLATGKTWFDRDTLQSAVLWVAAEDAFGVKLRTMAWMKHHGVTDVPFSVIKDGLFNLRKPETVDAIVHAAKDLLASSGLPRVLIVIDTLSRAAPGADEISGKDTGEVIAAFDMIRNALPATLCVIHHSGKNEDAGLRGHSSLGQGIDSYTKVRKHGIGHVMEFEKIKNAKIPAPIGFALEVVVVGQHPNGKIVDSCVVVPRDMKPVETGPINLSDAAKKCRDELATEVRDTGVELPNALTGGDGVRGALMLNWAKAYKARQCEGLKANTAKSQFVRARSRLLDDGLVRTCEVNGDEYAFILDTS